MKLISIRARNYRTLQDVCLSFSGTYCTISGQNNAGKSSVIRLLSALFRRGSDYPWDEPGFDYNEDRTQWLKQNPPVEIEYVTELSRMDDPALISFIERIASTKLPTPAVSVRLTYTVGDTNDLKIGLALNESPVEEKAVKDIERRSKIPTSFSFTTQQSHTRNTTLGEVG